MGYVVKTSKHCFGIDIHHRRGEELVPYLEFLLIIHNHNDHDTERLATAMTHADKNVYSNFFPGNGLIKESESIIEHGDLTIYTYESDHNTKLKNFIMPFEIVCGKEADACVLYTSGDSCNAKQLKHQSSKIKFHFVHPHVGLDIIESATQTLTPERTLISHLQELHHPCHKWRWSYVHGANAIERLQAVGCVGIMPLWGDKFHWEYPQKQ